MSLRRYMFEWYSAIGAKSVRQLVCAVDAKDAMAIFEKNSAEPLPGVQFGLGQPYKIIAVPDDACSECQGTGRVDRAHDGNFNIICGECQGRGTRP